jgi:ATP adenylyltransferase
MSEEPIANERNVNFWAPWRMEYLDSLGADEPDGCFFCRHRDEPDADRLHHVLWRGKHCFAMLNRFPYTGGHSMVAPYEHVAKLTDLSVATMTACMQMLRDLQVLLGEVTAAQGYNIGINIGRCAGAGVPGHLHLHIVPRWPGDTNFMPVFAKIRVIPESLDALYSKLLEASARLKLPTSQP